MAGTMKNEYMSLYRNTMLQMYQNEGMSLKEATSEYREHARSIEITSMSGPEIRDMTVDRLLYTNGIEWNAVQEAYQNGTKNPDMADRVVSEVYDLANTMAVDMVERGEWTSQNDQFLTDEQKMRASELDAQRAEEARDAAYEAAHSEPVVENVVEEKPEPTWTVKLGKDGQEHINAEFEGQQVHFPRLQNKGTEGEHVLSDAEISSLLKGEQIEIPGRSGEPVVRELGFYNYYGTKCGLVEPENGGNNGPSSPASASRALPDVQVGAEMDGPELG